MRSLGVASGLGVAISLRLSVLAAVLIIAGTKAADAADQDIIGTKLLLKGDKVVLLSKDPSISIAGSNPVGGGDSSVRFDDGSNSVTFSLPNTNWSANRPATVFTYQNAAAPDAPSAVKTAKLKGGLLKVVAKALPFAVPSGTATVTVVLSLDGGTNTYRMTFTGTGDGKRFLVKDAEIDTSPSPTPTLPPDPSLHCTNGTQDDDETDVDCGGSLCVGCPNGGSCTYQSDCATGYCCPSGGCLQCGGAVFGCAPDPFTAGTCQPSSTIGFNAQIASEVPISSCTYPTCGFMRPNSVVGFDFLQYDQTSRQWFSFTSHGGPLVEPDGPILKVGEPAGSLSECSGLFCYLYSVEERSWAITDVLTPTGSSLIYRTGFFSTPSDPRVPSGYNLELCSNGYCYRWFGWDRWVVREVDLPPVGDPVEPPPPMVNPSRFDSGFTASSECDLTYCYEKIDGEWGIVALIIPEGVTILR